MNKKIIGVIFCMSIITVGVIPAMGVPSFLDEYPELKPYVEEFLESYDVNYSENTGIISGPVLKTFTNVELLNGSAGQMNLINRYLSRKLLRPMAILRNVPIFVENLSFTVEFKRNVRNNSRFSYFSINYTVTVDENGMYNMTDWTSIGNEPHTVTIENMTGFFIFFRVRAFNLLAPLFRKFYWPASFGFVGFYDKITYS